MTISDDDIDNDKANQTTESQMKTKNLLVIASSGMSLNARSRERVSGRPMAGNSS